MNYTTTNELNHFDFKEACINEIRLSLDSLIFYLDNVKILPENSKNRDIRLMRTNNLTLKIANVTIESLVEEDYKVFNPNGDLLKKVPDRIVEKEQYSQEFQNLQGCFINSIEQKENSYIVNIDTEDHTYRFIFSGDANTIEWDRFFNL